ncbi:ATP-binding cassette domain-containing protein [Streptomyces sp. NPDC002790]|uniref:ATP-binding cassette domain-containing protein n=1 Tax=Streptomyces sp. NPDC002790 TaxID=3154431 RepID=UPI003325F5D6
MTIRALGLTKRYGGRNGKTVVDDLTFTVEPGTVTGFLGPNGAGKSTTMRMQLGLDTPTAGRATIGGRVYATHPAPLTEVGALLEAKAVHPGRTAFHHLTALALTHGIPRSRVEHILDLAGLTDVADKRVKGFSLGMGQRLGIAAELLGILITANEYSTGLVRATMAAVPRRLPVLWAKAGVFTAVAFTVTFATNLGTFLLAQIWLSDSDKALSLTDSGVLRALAGNAAGITLLSLIAFGLGALCRSAPAAIGAFVGAVMILPEVLQMISNDAVQSAVKYSR